LVLLHDLQPQTKLVLSLHDLNYLVENIDELRDVDFKPHLSTFLGDLLNEIHNQSNQIVWHYLILAICCIRRRFLVPDVLQTVVDDVNEGV
jgi:hypothetical protein